jgi:uncharacterized membrane protein
MSRVITVVFAALVLLSVAQAFWQHARLPETVASHFDASGKPNGWMPRGAQTAWHISTVFFMAGLLEGIARISQLIPDEYINIPHREHWLAPERRAATLAGLSTMVRLMGSVLLLFLMGLFHQVYRANTGGGSITEIVVVMSAALLVAVGIILVTGLLRFTRSPAA